MHGSGVPERVQTRASPAVIFAADSGGLQQPLKCVIDIVFPHARAVSVRKEGRLHAFGQRTARTPFGVSPQGIRERGSDGHETALAELGVPHRQYCAREVNITHGQMQPLTSAQSSSIQEQKQYTESVAIKARRVLAADLDGIEQELQFLTGVDVRWRSLRRSRLLICCRQWRPDGITAADRIAVKSREGTVLTGAPPGEWTDSIKESADVPLRHRIAAHVVGDPVTKLAQRTSAGIEPRTVGPAPRYIVLDRLPEHHTSPSRLISATSRSALSCTLA